MQVREEGPHALFCGDDDSTGGVIVCCPDCLEDYVDTTEPCEESWCPKCRRELFYHPNNEW